MDVELTIRFEAKLLFERRGRLNVNHLCREKGKHFVYNVRASRLTVCIIPFPSHNHEVLSRFGLFLLLFMPYSFSYMPNLYINYYIFFLMTSCLSAISYYPILFCYHTAGSLLCNFMCPTCICMH